jgi:multidrug resistance efflux pump
MLNISTNKLNKKVSLKQFKSGERVLKNGYHKRFNQFLLVFAVFCLIILFLPWTQNITSTGQVTTLMPNQRPQTIQSQIPGRIEEWFVKEGDFVKQGDTILRISEIKSAYFDDELSEKTNQQIVAKTSSKIAYEEKAKALQRQINALKEERTLKLKQAKNKLTQAKLKVKSDSIDLKVAKTNEDIAQRQYNRESTLQNEGLKATKDVEQKRIKLQEAQAKLISQENKYLASQNEVINYQIERSRVAAAYTDKISKAQSDMFTAQSNQYSTVAEVTKLKNSYTNYKKRSELLYVTAPQDGYVNKALKSGIGETFKEGEQLVGIMPAVYDLAVETYIEPIDLPLIHINEKVRVQFDGWPAIVFSGWPNVSYGTYGAKVVAIENFISENGKYRLLLAPDENDHQWPTAVRVGSGAKAIALLDDVPIWFELWRQLNGFPPNYYQPKVASLNTKKK